MIVFWWGVFGSMDHLLDKLETKDDAFARKECPAALRTLLMVSDGVNKPLSVVESYYFSAMNISH